MLRVVRKRECGTQSRLESISITDTAAQLIARNFDAAAAGEEVGDAAYEQSSIRIADDSCASKQVIACVVIHFEIRRRRSAGREAHCRNDRRKSPYSVGEGKTRKLQQG